MTEIQNDPMLLTFIVCFLLGLWLVTALAALCSIAGSVRVIADAVEKEAARAGCVAKSS